VVRVRVEAVDIADRSLWGSQTGQAYPLGGNSGCDARMSSSVSGGGTSRSGWRRGGVTFGAAWWSISPRLAGAWHLRAIHAHGYAADHWACMTTPFSG
jgi:hypothetical protein